MDACLPAVNVKIETQTNPWNLLCVFFFHFYEENKRMHCKSTSVDSFQSMHRRHASKFGLRVKNIHAFFRQFDF